MTLSSLDSNGSAAGMNHGTRDAEAVFVKSLRAVFSALLDPRHEGFTVVTPAGHGTATV